MATAAARSHDWELTPVSWISWQTLIPVPPELFAPPRGMRVVTASAARSLKTQVERALHVVRTRPTSLPLSHLARDLEHLEAVDRAGHAERSGGRRKRLHR